jgi:3-hydroxyacyl-CoA dehydrogenase
MKREIETVACAGAGPRRPGMARHIRPRGFDVILEDLEPGRLEEAPEEG